MWQGGRTTCRPTVVSHLVRLGSTLNRRMVRLTAAEKWLLTISKGTKTKGSILIHMEQCHVGMDCRTFHPNSSPALRKILPEISPAASNEERKVSRGYRRTRKAIATIISIIAASELLIVIFQMPDAKLAARAIMVRRLKRRRRVRMQYEIPTE